MRARDAFDLREPPRQARLLWCRCMTFQMRWDDGSVTAAPPARALTARRHPSLCGGPGDAL